MRRCTLGAAGLLWLALAAAAGAQGPDDAVQLRYRFQPGQEFRYRMTITGDMETSMSGLNLPGGAAAPRKIPMTMTCNWLMVQKVKSVSPEGVATITVGFDQMESGMAFMGMNITSRMAPDGKVETLMNGQPAQGAPAQTLPNPLAEMTIDSTGKVAGISPESLQKMSQLMGGQNLSSMFGGSMPGVGGLILPAKPVKPGETWDSKMTLRMPIPMPGPAGGAAGAGPVLTANYAIVNKLLRVENGHAIVETRITATSPPGAKVPLNTMPGGPTGMTMAIEKMEQTMTGTQRFQIEEGAVAGNDFDATMDMRMAMGLPPGLGAPPGAAPAPKPAARKNPPRTTAKGAKSRASTKPAVPSARSAPPAAAPMSLKIGMGGTMKIKLERLAAADATAPPPAPAP
jgi:hypothetical protein